MTNNDRFEVHKFGGSSLADANCYRHVASLLSQLSDQARLCVVVSASGLTTDRLVESTRQAVHGSPRDSPALGSVETHHRELIETLLSKRSAEALLQRLQTDLADIERLLQTIAQSKHVSNELEALICGYGELWSAQLLVACLSEVTSEVDAFDSRDFITIDPGLLPRVAWNETRQRFESIRLQLGRLAVFPGFIGRTARGTPATLGRNGSDFTATILGKLLPAREVTIWTNVLGVLSADPRRVREAIVLPEVSYLEARELAHFGASVLHPRTMDPVMEAGVPLRIRSTFTPQHPGSVIRAAPKAAGETSSPPRSVKGFSTIDDVVLLNVEGSALAGIPGVAQRLFAALQERGISVVMISQAGSETSICFAVRNADRGAAREAAENAFALERQAGTVGPVMITEDCCVLAAIGDEMVHRPGVAARFFAGLARAGVNVLAIAQGSSERNISAAIAASDSTRALRAVHASFYLSRRTISLGLVGPGQIGHEFLDQLRAQRDALWRDYDVDVRLRGITNSRIMLLDHDIQLDDWPRHFRDASQAADLQAFSRHLQSETTPHSVIVDCSASAEVARHYVDWLARGIHIVTPNKKANTEGLDYYHRLRTERRPFTGYYYEATVGAGLPVISTLQDLIRTGDTIHKIEGVFSGTLSFLFNEFVEGRSFSEILSEARQRGFTEPDPRDDLSGEDFARKLVILSREIGRELEVENVKVESLVPHELAGTSSVDAFLQALPRFDAHWESRRQRAAAQDQVLRYVGRVDRDGQATVAIEAIPRRHPFAQIQGSENIFAFTTKRYHSSPLIIRGPGAGPEVTAAGVFSDLLRVVLQLNLDS